MSKPEEFKIVIRPDGRIELDFRGMDATSYKRIIQLLEETVGPVEPLEAEAEEGTPPGVRQTKEKKIDASKDQELKGF